MNAVDDSESIKREIAATRERLNASVEALVYRANVPARAKEAVDAKIGTVKHAMRGALGRGRRSVAAAADHAIADSEDVLERAQSMAASAVRSFSAMRTTLGEPLPHAVDVRTNHVMSKGRSNFMQAFLERNPLGFALTSVAVGVLIGSVLPISDLERDTVGPVGQHLIEEVTSTAGEVIEHGKAVVSTIVAES